MTTHVTSRDRDRWPEPGGDAPGGVPDRLTFTEHFRCPDHPDVVFLDPSPQLFSFNNPYGTCPLCTGFGATLEYDPEMPGFTKPLR